MTDFHADIQTALYSEMQYRKCEQPTKNSKKKPEHVQCVHDCIAHDSHNKLNVSVFQF